MKRKAKHGSKKNPGKIRWEYLVPGLLAGGWGAWLLSEDPNWLFGLPVQALSLWAIWKAFPPKSETFLPPAEKIPPPNSRDKRLNWPVISAAVLWFITYLCFEKRWWAAGVVGVVLLLGILFYSIGRFKSLPQPREFFSEKAVLGVLLVLTVLLRFPFLGQSFTGFQNDEANNLLGAMDVLQGKLRTPFTGEFNFSTLPYFLLAPFIKVFGTTLAAGRGAAAFLSVIAVYFFFRWCRLYFGVAASGLAAFFFSYCWWNLFNSLSPFLHIATVLFEILSFYFLAQALRIGRRLYFGLSGLFMAMCFMSYIAGRLAPVMAVLALAGYCCFEGKRFLKAYWKHILFALLGFLWLIGPYLIHMMKNTGIFFGRIQELNLLQYADERHDYALPYERLVTTFYTFFWPNPYSDMGSALKNIPCIDPFLGFFCFVGMVSSLFFFRRRRNLLALCVLTFGVLSNAFAGPNFEPAYFNKFHCIMALPILCFLTAQGADAVMRFFATKPKPFRVMGFSFLALMAGASLASNVRDYFFKFSDSPTAWNSLGFNHMAHAAVIESFYPGHHIVAEGHVLYGLFYSSCYDRVEEFLTHHKVPVNKAAPLAMPIRAAVAKDVVLFLSDWEKYDSEKEKVRKFYSRAVFKDYQNKFGETYLTTIEIAKEDIQRLQKGLKLDQPLL